MAAEKSDEGTETKSQVAGLITLALVSPIYFIFAHFGHPQKGFLVTCVTGVFAAIIYVKGRTLLKPYSASAMAVLFVAQIFGVLLVDIPVPRSFSIAVLPFVIFDLVLAFAILALVDRAFGLPDKGR